MSEVSQNMVHNSDDDHDDTMEITIDDATLSSLTAGSEQSDTSVIELEQECSDGTSMTELEQERDRLLTELKQYDQPKCDVPFDIEEFCVMDLQIAKCIRHSRGDVIKHNFICEMCVLCSRDGQMVGANWIFSPPLDTRSLIRNTYSNIRPNTARINFSIKKFITLLTAEQFVILKGDTKLHQIRKMIQTTKCTSLRVHDRQHAMIITKEDGSYTVCVDISNRQLFCDPDLPFIHFKPPTFSICMKNRTADTHFTCGNHFNPLTSACAYSNAFVIYNWLVDQKFIS